jgi:hypothetical protein
MQIKLDTPYGVFLVEQVYVIKKDDHTYFTEVRSVETIPVRLNGNIVGHNTTYRPMFEAAHQRFATRFDTVKDAEAFMNDPEYGAPEAFAGCKVIPLER